MKDTSYVYRIASTVITDSRAFFSGNVELEERVVPSPPRYGNSSWSLTAGSSPRYQRSPSPLGKRRPIRIPTLAQVPASLRSWTCQKTKSLLPMFTPWGHAAAPDAQSVSSSLNVDRLRRAAFKNRRSAGAKVLYRPVSLFRRRARGGIP